MLYWLVILPILTAVLLFFFPFGKVGKVIALAAQAVLFVAAFRVFLLCKNGDVITNIGDYRDILGVWLKADTLSSVFILLATLLFTVVIIYNLNESFDGLFWFLLFVWEGLLIGIFLSNDFFNIFVLVEVVTVIVSIFIMFKRDNRSMYDGMVYLMVSTVSVQFYLFGIGYIYKLTGTLDIDAAAKALALLDKSSLILPFALIMTFVSLKCALMPLFSWLPKAHGTPGAPASVSALLSGLHIKSGIYLFIRFHDAFQTINLSDFFLVAGIITGIAGFILALSQTDIKLILAYHTISQIGLIMIGLNIDNVYSYTGGVYHVINHAFFKSALFLTAGIIIQAYGTRNIYEVRGVLKRLPSVGAVMLMSIMGITGAPFFNGSISKYFIMSGSNGIVSGMILFINLGTVISFIKYSSMLFGKAEGGVVKIDLFKQISILILGTLCLIGGIFGQQVINFLFNTSVKVDTFGYIQKAASFAASVLLGYSVYKYYVKNSSLLKRINAIELSFKGICVSIGVYFAVILLAANFMA